MYALLISKGSQTSSVGGCSLSGDGDGDGDASSPGVSDTSSGTGSTQKAQGHHRHRGGGLLKSIQDAVTSALQSTSADGSTNSTDGSATDLNKVIEQAIAQVFKQGPGGAGQAGKGTSAEEGGLPPGPPPAPPNAAAGDSNITSSSESSDSSGLQAFLQLLQSFGIDKQQFQNDLKAAIKDARGGQVEPSKIFKSIPAGAVVDATA